MSYESWHTYGYGICVSDIEAEKPDVKRLQSLLSLAPKLNKRIAQWLAEADLSSPEYEDYMEFDQDYMLGLAYLLKEVILEAEVIEFTACDDFTGILSLFMNLDIPGRQEKREIDAGKRYSGYFQNMYLF